jgi:hypothetical protein
MHHVKALGRVIHSEYAAITIGGVMSNVEPTVNVGTIGHVDNDKSTLTEVVVVCGSGRPDMKNVDLMIFDDEPAQDPGPYEPYGHLQDWQQPGKRRMGRPR